MLHTGLSLSNIHTCCGLSEKFLVAFSLGKTLETKENRQCGPYLVRFLHYITFVNDNHSNERKER